MRKTTASHTFLYSNTIASGYKLRQGFLVILRSRAEISGARISEEVFADVLESVKRFGGLCPQFEDVTRVAIMEFPGRLTPFAIRS
jgi:hypothetical protein